MRAEQYRPNRDSVAHRYQVVGGIHSCWILDLSY